MPISENKKSDNYVFKSIWYVLNRNLKGSGLFLSGIALCLIGVGITINKQLSLASDPYEKSIVVTLVGSGLPLILAGINLILRPKKLYIYLTSVGILVSIISLTIFYRYYPEGLYYPVITWVCLPYISGLTLLTAIIFANALEMLPQLPAKKVPFSTLRERLDYVINQSGDMNSRLKLFQDELEKWGAASWQKEKKSKDKYYCITDSLILLLDHLENLAKSEKRSDELDWLYKRTRRILEDEGIEEIPVKKGDRFDGLYHKQVSDQPDEHPLGTVLEVARKGYYEKGVTGGDDVILRPVEVIVSSGLSGKQPESKRSKEEEK
jgi:molecular chaperone GrpE (heat shock protein)